MIDIKIFVLALMLAVFPIIGVLIGVSIGKISEIAIDPIIKDTSIYNLILKISLSLMMYSVFMILILKYFAPILKSFTDGIFV